MIAVYVRELSQEAGILLGEFAPKSITSLVSLFKVYETTVNEGSAKFLMAHFVSDDGFSAGTYFEIVVEYPTESV